MMLGQCGGVLFHFLKSSFGLADKTTSQCCDMLENPSNLMIKTAIIKTFYIIVQVIFWISGSR
jgi:hypothetical protein